MAGIHLLASPVDPRKWHHVILKLRCHQFLACHSGLAWPKANGHLAGSESLEGEAMCVEDTGGR